MITSPSLRPEQPSGATSTGPSMSGYAPYSLKYARRLRLDQLAIAEVHCDRRSRLGGRPAQSIGTKFGRDTRSVFILQIMRAYNRWNSTGTPRLCRKKVSTCASEHANEESSTNEKEHKDTHKTS